jgi:proteasome lid subunit RPN8/RPN11
MTVFIPKEVYLTVVAACVRYANRRIDKDDWLEVSGIFIGKNEGEDVHISKSYPIMHQELDKDAVIDQYKWSNEDYEAFSIIDDEAFSRGEFTVGWWHSHPGFKIMMSHIDIRTTLGYQTNNALAISLVFNPDRLERQVELPVKKGDPVKQLEDDPGFKIFRLDDVNKGIQASYHTVEYVITGYDNQEQIVPLAQKFLIDITNMFPKGNIFKTYEKFITDRINELNSRLQGIEEYLNTLTRKGESHRVIEVLNSQTQDIRKFIAETFIKVENIKQFKNYLEYKEISTIVPKVETILAEWDETVSQLNAKLTGIAKKFAF